MKGRIMLARALRRVTVPIARTTAALCVLYVTAGAVLAYFLFSSLNSQVRVSTLDIRSIGPTHSALTLEQALIELRRVEKISPEVSTNLSERPFWIAARLPAVTEPASLSVYFPSRHAQKLLVWVIDSENHIVLADQIGQGSDGRFLQSKKSGFSITIPYTESPLQLVAQIHSRGPARISAEVWGSEDLALAARQFDQAGGVLFGSLLIIAAFGTLIAVLARDTTFFIFAAWTITSLRFASHSNGWDFTWLGLAELDHYPRIIRNLSLAAYAVLTVALFRGLFKRDIARLGASMPIRVIQLLSASMLLVGLIAPQRIFLPVMWALAIPCLMYMMALTAVIIAKTGSNTALWYCASWLVTLSAAITEIGYATGLISRIPSILNSVSGAVFSTLLAAIALADRIKTEKLERVKAQAKTAIVLNRFKENFNSMPIGLFNTSSDGALSLYNPAFEGMFPKASPRPVNGGQHIDLVVCDGTLQKLKDATSDGITDIELEVPTDTGEVRWFLARVTSNQGAVEGAIQEITNRKAAEKQLRHLVDHDPLTGLLNRRGLDAALGALVKDVRIGKSGAIAYVDLDRFKLVNDLYGHATGDALLAQSAERLLTCVRSGDSVARLAGAFVILFPDCPDYAVSGLTERVRASIGDSPFDIDGKGLSVTTSVGVVSIDQSMSSIDAIAAADRACAEAKSRGRNCVVRLMEHDSELKSHLEELKVVADLQQRLPTERYFLEFQPIIALQSAMTSLSYEVLIRMRGEGGEVVPPGKFIGAAERNGLMSQIDRWVLRTTLEWLDSHPDHRQKLTFATINISGASLNDARFIEDAFSMIAEHPLAMSKLCFEITEGVALHDIGSTKRFVDRVRMYGTKLALDDFGAGYTSFNYLKEIPADFIKIDGSFVRDINRNPANYAITRMIVELTHELGMRSIAEWAETPDTIASLIELGVDYGQGYALVRPVAPAIVSAAPSGAALIRDPQVIALLEERARSVPLPQLRRRPQHDPG